MRHAKEQSNWVTRLAATVGTLLLGAAAACGCGGSEPSMLGSDGGGDGGGSSQEPPPGVGAHAIVFQRNYGGQTSIATPALSTSASGSTLIVGVGRGVFSAFTPPTDNKGNTFQQLGAAQRYTRYSDSGTAIYAVPGAQGGGGHVLRSTMPASDEITMGVVEVKGTKVVDFAWREVLRENPPITSAKVTTTGPATLVAFWWGDHDPREEKTAKPNNGFQVIESVLASGELVQSALAVKQVTAAGSYDVTWTSTPVQGAQLWLIAVQE